MMRSLLLYAMASEVSFDGTTLVERALPNSEIAQRIKEVMEPLWDNAGAALDFVYSVPRHPLMRPEPGYVVFVSFPFSCLLFVTLRGAGPAEGPHSHESPGAIAEGFGYEDGESRRG